MHACSWSREIIRHFFHALGELSKHLDASATCPKAFTLPISVSLTLPLSSPSTSHLSSLFNVNNRQHVNLCGERPPCDCKKKNISKRECNRVVCECAKIADFRRSCMLRLRVFCCRVIGTTTRVGCLSSELETSVVDNTNLTVCSSGIGSPGFWVTLVSSNFWPTHIEQFFLRSNC